MFGPRNGKNKVHPEGCRKPQRVAFCPLDLSFTYSANCSIIHLSAWSQFLGPTTLGQGKVV